MNQRQQQERVQQLALSYAAKGWKIVILGDAGTHRAKIPRLPKWQDLATDDEEKLAEWLDKWPLSNIGLLLGPKTGLIDVEFDSDEGRATADRLFGQTITPTYASSRSVHRLFRWDGRFPQTAKIDISGLEIRLGGGGKGAQSVLPPSLHTSGETYYWLSGLSPDEVEPADLPKELLVKLTNVEYGLEASGASSAAFSFEGGRSAEEWAEIDGGVAEGRRNDALAAYTGRELAKMTNEELESKDEILGAFNKVVGQNQRNRPPLEIKEVESIFRSILGRERKKRSSQIYAEQATITLNEDDQTLGFSLVIVEGEPTEFILSSQLFAGIGGSISMDAEQIQSFSKVRSIVLDRARVLLAKQLAKKWDQVLSVLISIAERRDPNPELDRPAVIASVILEAYEPTVRTALAEIREYGVGGCFGVETVDEKTVAVSVRQLKNHLKVDWILDSPKQSEIVKLLESCGGEVRIGKTRVWFVPVSELKRVARLPS